MTKEKQVQKAGDNSNQVQIDTVVNVNGVSEERVREIIAEVSQRAIQDQTQEANEIFLKRVDKFTDLLLPRIESIEKKFESFQEPDFQVLLKKAQISAGCSDRELDYGVLSELLVHRVKHKSNIKKKASIAKAVEIINQIDNDALCGLTMYVAIIKFSPTSGVATKGLSVINSLYGKLLYEELPSNKEWIDNLDILGVITTSAAGSRKTYNDFICQAWEGYLLPGLKKDSEEYQKAIDLLKSAKITNQVLIENEFDSNYVKLPFLRKEYITKINPTIDVNIGGVWYPLQVSFTEEQKEVLSQIWDMYTNDVDATNNIKNKFIELLYSFDKIKKVSYWWDNIGTMFNVNSIGRIIGHTNAKNYDPTIPDIDD